MRCSRHAVIATLLTAGAVGFAQKPHSGPWPATLEKAIRVAGSLRYSGERVVELREGSERFTHREIVWRDGENIRIEYPAGSRSEGQIVVERGRKRWHYFPDRKEVQMSPSRRDETMQRLVGSLKFGAGRGASVFVVDDGGMVAGVRTQRVSLKGPRGQVVQSLWIDDRTGMILKRELFNPVGGREGYFEFTRVNMQPKFRASDFELRVPGARLVSPTELALRYMKDGKFLRVFLDESGEMELEGARRFGGEEGLALHYRLKNTVLSLIQVKSAVEPRMLDRMRRDGQHVLTWKKGERSFILIGSLPESELKAISLKAQER